MVIAKSEGAYRTIGELADELALPQHILRYWETRFPQLRPLQRANKRRYYRPEDVALARRIHGLLNHEGYTIRGVQKLLNGQDAAPSQNRQRSIGAELRTIRDRLEGALAPETALSPEA